MARTIASSLTIGLTLALAAVLSPAGATGEQDEKKPAADQFTATVISPNAPGLNGSSVQVWIESYSSDDVLGTLVKTLAEKGQTGLLDSMKDLHVGTIKVGTNSAIPISVARQRPNEDGSRTLFIATARPFAGFPESAGMPIEQYPFGFVKLNVPAGDAKGDGTIVGAAQLELDAATKSLSIKGSGTQPGRLSNVKAVKPKS